MPTSPRVLIDATSIPPTQGGVARFIEGLLRGLDELEFPVEVVAKRADIAQLHAVAPRHRYLVAPPGVSSRPLRLLWEQLGLPSLARRRGVELIHSPHYTFPLFTRTARLVTLHDATFFSSPEVHSRLKGTFFRTWIRQASSRTDRLVAASQATVREVTENVAKVIPEIDVAYLGVDSAVFSPPSPQSVAAVRDFLGLAPNEEWIAFLGTMEPRKNIPALIQAHQSLDPESTPRLVLSGARGWDEDANAALDQIAATPGRRIIEAGYLPLELLEAFLGGSSFVVYPSLGEGFGLPVLEAMASQAAVLTTRRLSIPEVGGDAVAYSEPDADSLAQAMAELLNDPAERARLAAAGLERSAGFSWAECARRYIAAYREGVAAHSAAESAGSSRRDAAQEHTKVMP